MNLPKRHTESFFIIVGAGAAGAAAAKCFTASGLAERTLLIEKHSEPGGSAGYFSRGQPRRTFDAGATQLIECSPGHIQHELFTLSPALNQPRAEEVFERIPCVTQHWDGQDRKVVLHADGRVEWRGAHAPSAEETAELQLLEKFLSICLREANWMWTLLSHIPRFPLQSFSDVARALKVFLHVPFRKKITFPFLFLFNCEQMMRWHGIRRSGLAFDVLSGLLVDTTQNIPAKSPWLAASMGISIVARGIFRCRKGMRSYFRPLISSFEEHGGHYSPHQSLVGLQTTERGFLLTLRNQRTQELTQFETHQSVMLNMTVWDVVNGIIPENDPLTQTRVYRRWQSIAKNEQGWGAFALHALITDQPEWPDAPFYHQIFPSENEPPELQSSLYVSIPARNDAANPSGSRVLTATLHVRTNAVSEERRSEFKDILVARIERNLNSRLMQVESATPRTFERYIGRLHGQVGGFPLRLSNFLFLAPPSTIYHPFQSSCRLIVMGDTVFPGQGVVACSVSGIAAFERASGMNFQEMPRIS